MPAVTRDDIKTSNFVCDLALCLLALDVGETHSLTLEDEHFTWKRVK